MAIPIPAPTAQLEVIAERPGGSGQESDDDEDDVWQPGIGRSLEELNNLTDEVVAKAGYLDKKGERRKVQHTNVCPLQDLTCFCTDLAEALVRPAADATLVLQNGKGVQAAAPSALSRDSLCHPSHPEASFALLWSYYAFQDLLRPGRLRSGRRELG